MGDFDMMVLVHDVKFTSQSQTTTFVRARAGDIVAETDPNANGIFQQTLNIVIGQGTELLEFDLLDERKRCLAQLRFDIMKDILKDGSTATAKEVIEKTFNMKQKQKSILNPKITLTFSPEQMGDEEKALLSGLNASAETEWMLTQHIQMVQSNEPSAKVEELSEIDLLGKACHGPLEMFEKMGNNNTVYIGIVGPPKKKKYALRIWDTEKEYTEGKASIEDIDLLKVMGITPDPSRPEVFVVDFLDDNKAKRNVKFARVDRGRD